MAFNRNDAVGLFKNGVLIDIIGTFNRGTADFAIDITLRRKSAITLPQLQHLIELRIRILIPLTRVVIWEVVSKQNQLKPQQL